MSKQELPSKMSPLQSYQEGVAIQANRGRKSKKKSRKKGEPAKIHTDWRIEFPMVLLFTAFVICVMRAIDMLQTLWVLYDINQPLFTSLRKDNSLFFPQVLWLLMTCVKRTDMPTQLMENNRRVSSSQLICKKGMMLHLSAGRMRRPLGTTKGVEEKDRH